MIKINTTTNVSANIYVGEAENQKNVAYANASVSRMVTFLLTNPFKMVKHLKQIKNQF